MCLLTKIMILHCILAVTSISNKKRLSWLLLTDYFFHLMRQLRMCRFSEADRKTRGGKREKIKIGYGGLQCIHCADLPMSRKFFWSNVDRLANSFAEIPGHILKCKRCPPQCKEALLQLKQGHPDQMSKLPRGSQKVFFRRMWRRLHDDDPEGDDQASSTKAAEGTAVKAPPSPPAAIKTDPESPDSKKGADNSPSSGQSEETTLVVQRSAKDVDAETLKKLLRKNLEADFELHQQTRQSEIKRLQELLKKSEEWLILILSGASPEQKEEIIDKQLQELMKHANQKKPADPFSAGSNTDPRQNFFTPAPEATIRK